MGAVVRFLSVLLVFGFLCFPQAGGAQTADGRNSAGPERSRLAVPGFRETMDDYDRRLYDRVKKSNRQNIQIRGIAIVGFTVLLACVIIATIVIVRRINRLERPPIAALDERPDRLPPAKPAAESQSAQDEEPPRGGGFEVWAGRIFIALAVSIVSFFVFDALVGPHLNTRSRLEGTAGLSTIRSPKPYVMFGGKEEQPNPAGGINRRGYRGRLATMPKPQDEFRVFVLGGSTVWNGDPPIAQLLERRFAEAGYGFVRVYNYGVVSSVSGMALVRLVHEIGDLAPDLVVFFNGGNDMLHAFGPDRRIGYPYNFLVWEANPLLESELERYPAAALFLYGSRTLRFVFADWFERTFSRLSYRNGVQPVLVQDPSWYDAVAANYGSNVRKAARFSHALNSKYAVFLQPTIFSKNPLSDDEAKLRIFDRKKIEHVGGLLRAFRAELNRVAVTEGIPAFDLSTLFDGNPETVFADNIHISQAAKNIVAEALFRSLSPLVPKR